TIYTITFAGGLASANLAQITVTSSLTGGTVTPSTVRDGIGNEVQTITLGGTSGGTFTVSFGGVAATSGALTFTTGSSPTAAQLPTHLNSIPALNGNAPLTGGNARPSTVVFDNALANVIVAAMTTAVTGGTTASVATVSDGVGNELQTITLGGTSGGTFNVSFGAVAATSGALTFTTGSSPTAAQLLAHLN